MMQSSYRPLHKRMKVELLKEKNLECATEAYIDGLYYYRMYFSPACWKDDRRVVAKHLKKITSDTAKYNALKENIMIRVKGFSWDWCKHPWSKDGRKYTIKELADHLRWIITEEKKHSIPDEPSLNVPQRINLPVLGTPTEEVLELDRKYLATGDAFKKKARKLRNERELKGEGSIYSSMQPFVRPEISDLMNERIDVLSEFKMLGKEGSELRWCQGEVVHVYKDQRVPMVRVRWDPIPDCTGWESSTESNPKNYYQLDGTRMWLVHGDWTYQLMLRNHLTMKVMEVAMKLRLAMMMVMATVSVV